MPVEVGIIGGGFTGTAVAVHLANAAQMPVGIDVIEPREAVGYGLAYGTCRPEHRINVPSDRMVVFREDPLHYTRWLQGNGILAADLEGREENGDFYSRRSDFGSYMESLFRETAVSNGSGSRLRHRRSAATGFEPDGSGWRVRLADSTLARYSHLVLAATHTTPALHWPIDGDAAEARGFIADPWAWEAISSISKDADVAILGTGLTMCDVVVTLRAEGHRGHITAVSRRALTPRPQAGFGNEFDLFGAQQPPATAIGLLRLVRARVAEAEAAGDNWQSVVNALRSRLPAYWPTLPLPEQARIARRLRAWWDVHRFRIAPSVDRLIAEGGGEGWLSIRAGRIHRIGTAGDRMILDWTPRYERRHEATFSAIINCTGPDSNIARSPIPAVRRAVEEGHIRPDALRIGVDVDSSGHAIDRAGLPHSNLWVAGPLARAVVGEATGLPEVSDNARNVANSLAASLALVRS